MSSSPEAASLAPSADQAPLAPTDVNVRNHSVFYTRFCADSVECCPHPGRENMCAVGSYELLGDKTRVGQILLASVCPAASSEVSLPPEEVCTITSISAETYANPDHVVDMSSEAAAPLPRASRTTGAPYFAPYARENTPAVLDIKWRPVPVPADEAGEGQSTFAAAFGDGTLRLYSAPTADASVTDSAASPARMVELWGLRPCAVDEDTTPALALALDWGERAARPSDDYDDYDDDDGNGDDDKEVGSGKKKVPVIAVSFSSGVVGIIDLPPSCSPANNPESAALTASQRPSVRHLWRAHDAEAWICALDPHADDSRFGQWVYSGGDDCRLKVWDQRMLPLSEVDEEKGGVGDGFDAGGCEPVAKGVFPVANLSEHTGGVVAIRPHPTNPCLLASGAYDDCLLLWDKRNFAKPIARWESGGGVWRTRWRPQRSLGAKLLDFDEAVEDAETLCVVNMYNGMHIVRAKGVFVPPNATVETHSAGTGAGVFGEAEMMQHLAKDVALATEGSIEISPSSSYHQCGSKTILYGGDWVHGDTRTLFAGLGEEKMAPAVIAGCSFYNKRVALWSPADQMNE